ncbi:sulfite exporter TauE/SafE family protein [Pseudoroseomonas ludipueritiae]|uniref:Probable membrane transporter protein n=1 Tax=Pseudoroseomonas ludipueritiae TaxID=198093 RepID=A0ABR7RB10_9PROT|nr:sulfite exporter TauE/SafE family protein [Pseudoroseomonas ludipueritiae]MBC9178955.1 sulfite exporter TauE/SafE family protein [Pseudoroseomonas ludipueritiae]MCG7364253.1 sulfite exporter TauE/SafE family protein [Roseomonas sp. ACRSG]
MQVYLPIAEMSVDAFLLLGIGFGVGWLSGMFGVGGGFLLTPLLILIGIPAPVAVASGANQTLGASVSGLIAQWRRGNVDLRMGGVLLAGGFFGSFLGVQVFAWLRRQGQVDLAVALFYVVVLGSVGGLMVRESVRAILQRRQGKAPRRLHPHFWMHGLPFKLRFRKSRLYISVIPPVLVGFGIGILSAIMGVGGGFMLVPAMIYLLGMPTSVVIGTSLFQVVFVAANVTLLQAINTGSVDIVLTLLLLIGGVAGAQFGAAMGTRLRGEETRALLGMLVLAVAGSLLWGLLSTPESLYVIGPLP